MSDIKRPAAGSVLHSVSTSVEKPGGEGGTAGIVAEAAEVMTVHAVSTAIDKPGTEGGTPGVMASKLQE